MLLRPSNFLLLDEPTNHLDMRAKDVLLESLQSYTGTVVFVSHDRYFLENVANRVFEIGDGAVHVFPGNYADYVWRKEGGHEQTPTLKDVLIGVPRAQPIPMPTPPQQPGKRINPLKLKQMQERAQALEARIAELEQSIQASELSLSDFTTAAEATRVSLALESQRAELDRTMNEWEKVTAEIEAPA
jgi:ATP-binding cassette subfamily F protein 3